MAFAGFIKASERPQRTGEERTDKAPQNPGGKTREHGRKKTGGRTNRRETKGETVVILQHALDFVFSSSSRAPSSAAAPELHLQQQLHQKQ
jgi:hypothetical protein